MGETKELRKIKKIYGEKFKNLCRDLFPIIIEQEGVLFSILEKRFSHNCNSLYEAITENGLEEDFKEYIFSEFDLKREEVEEEKRTPYEILEEKGYDLIECKTEEDIQSFRKYYAPGEVLCTIYNGGRLKTRDCFFAVRKDVDKIRREDFKTPDKSDEYSTSVLGIQFSRDKTSTVQIISRYNHTVSNPNCTLGNDLDKLAPGLSQSFTNLLKQRGLNLTQKNIERFAIPGYTLARDGKYYKYNWEINGNYYCPGNIIISNGRARSIGELEKGLLIDNFYIDFQNKTIRNMLDEERCKEESFLDAFQDIEKIEVERTDSGNKTIKIFIANAEEPAFIEIDRDNQMVGYTNHNITHLGDNFLRFHQGLTRLELPNLQEIGDCFLFINKGLTQLKLPNLQKVGESFLCWNKVLTRLEIPSLQKVGAYFLYHNEELMELEMPNLQEAGDSFLGHNVGLTRLELPNLREVGDCFLRHNEELIELELPNLQEVGECFLNNNEVLTELELPSLQKIVGNFLSNNVGLTRLELPNLQEVGNDFLASNKALSQLELPKLQEAGDSFLASNRALNQLELPNLQEVGDDFLRGNSGLTQLELPNLQEAGDYFLCFNKALVQLEIPNLQKVGDYFLCNNNRLNQLDLPNLQEAGASFLSDNEVISQLELPNLQKVGGGFLYWNEGFTKVSIPKLPELEESFQEIVARNTMTHGDNINSDEKETLIDKIHEKMATVKKQEDEIEKLQQEKNRQIPQNIQQH